MDLTADAANDAPRVEPLAKLAAGVVSNSLLKRRRMIPREAEASISQRKIDLLRQLQALDAEKEEYITRETARLDEDVEIALDHLAPAGVADRYCAKCNAFYFVTSAKSFCSIEGCQSHLLCPTCERFNIPPVPRYPEFDEEPSEMAGYFWENEAGRGNPYGYTRGYGNGSKIPESVHEIECWMCKGTFCPNHFERHYHTCREVARRHCGFRRPTAENRGNACLCVPGHCGKDINLKRGEGIICRRDYDFANCETCCCNDCAQECDGYDGNDGFGDPVKCIYYGRKMCKVCKAKCSHPPPTRTEPLPGFCRTYLDSP